MSESRQYDIPKRAVIDAYKRVKANKGSAGPVMVVEIPKKTGGTRRLGVLTIIERVAQMVARMYVEQAVEPMFCEDSYGYRPNKSALDAVGTARKRCWKYDYAIELDVKGLFDNIDHELLMRVVHRHVGQAWICMYIGRWLKTPFVQRDGQVIERNSGTPQGGVISPVLANMFFTLCI